MLTTAQLLAVIRGIPGLSCKWGDGESSVAGFVGDTLALSAVDAGLTWLVAFHGDQWTIPAYIPKEDTMEVVAGWPRVTWFYGHHPE
jgi:hypothetical protein